MSQECSEPGVDFGVDFLDTSPSRVILPESNKPLLYSQECHVGLSERGKDNRSPCTSFKGPRFGTFQFLIALSKPAGGDFPGGLLGVEVKERNKNPTATRLFLGGRPHNMGCSSFSKVTHFLRGKGKPKRAFLGCPRC